MMTWHIYIMTLVDPRTILDLITKFKDFFRPFKRLGTKLIRETLGTKLAILVPKLAILPKQREKVNEEKKSKTKQLHK